MNIFERAARDPHLSNSALQLIDTLATEVGPHGVVRLTEQELAELTGIPRGTVCTALKALETRAYIHRARSSRRLSTVITLAA